MKILSIAMLLGLLVTSGIAQTSVVGDTGIYMARDDGHGKPGEETTGFYTTDVPIHCVVLLETNQAVTVKMNFVAVSVPGVKAETKVVTTSYTTQGQQNRVNFTGRPDGKWYSGKYRVDIFVDGELSKSMVFDIRPTDSNDPFTKGSAFLKTGKGKQGNVTRKSRKN